MTNSSPHQRLEEIKERLHRDFFIDKANLHLIGDAQWLLSEITRYRTALYDIEEHAIDLASLRDTQDSESQMVTLAWEIKDIARSALEG